jgi:hypothetical protein
MNIPEPKYQLAIELISKWQRLVIFWAIPDIVESLRASGLGEVTMPTREDMKTGIEYSDGVWMTFKVHPVFDFNEVVAWLVSLADNSVILDARSVPWRGTAWIEEKAQ